MNDSDFLNGKTFGSVWQIHEANFDFTFLELLSDRLQSCPVDQFDTHIRMSSRPEYFSDEAIEYVDPAHR